jgi:ankyrin repeat protein
MTDPRNFIKYGSLKDFKKSLEKSLKNIDLYAIEMLKEEAAKSDRRDILEYLFELGLRFYIHETNTTFAHTAISYNSKECLKYLVEKFRDCINDVHAGKIPIFASAVYYNRPELVQILLDNGADVYINGSDYRVFEFITRYIESGEGEWKENAIKIKEMIDDHIKNLAVLNNSAKSARMRK